MDKRRTNDDEKRSFDDMGLDIQVDSALHRVSGAFLERESKMLAETAEINNPHELKMHKSGMLKYNFDRASAFIVISILEAIRNMQPARNIQDALPKITALERAQQENSKQALASRANRKCIVRQAKVNSTPVHPAFVDSATGESA